MYREVFEILKKLEFVLGKVNRFRRFWGFERMEFSKDFVDVGDLRDLQCLRDWRDLIGLTIYFNLPNKLIVGQL